VSAGAEIRSRWREGKFVFTLVRASLFSASAMTTVDSLEWEEEEEEEEDRENGGGRGGDGFRVDRLQKGIRQV
jgi:hypothetical protein